MINWTSDIKRFNAPSGRIIAVNGTPDCWCIDQCDPGAMEAAVEYALAAPGYPPDRNFVAACRVFPRDGDTVETQRWIESTLLMTKQGGDRMAVARPIHLLAMLRYHNVILFPAAVRFLPHPVDTIDPDRRFLMRSGHTSFEEELLDKVSAAYGFRGHDLLMSCSPIGSIEDVCDDALMEAIEVVARSEYWSQWNGGSSTIVFRQLEGRVRRDGKPIVILDRVHTMLHESALTGKNPPRYGEAGSRSDAEPWLSWFGKASTLARKKYGHLQDRSFAHLLDYLSSGGCNPPPGDAMPGEPAIGTILRPEDLTRDLHIIGPKGLLAWLRNQLDGDASYYRLVVMNIQGLFALMLKDDAINAILINDGDIPPKGPVNNKTNKAIIPRAQNELALQVVREIIAEAHIQFAALSSQGWRGAGMVVPRSDAARMLGDEGGRLPATLLEPALFKSLLVTLRGDDGTVTRIINPVMPVLLLWELRMPNRTREVRLLDSGEADELKCHLEVLPGSDGGPDQINVSWTPNDHPLAKVGRQLGMIQEQDDFEFRRRITGFYINTNKFQDGGHCDGEDRGRFLPWQDTEMLRNTYFVRTWNERFNPVNRFLTRDELRDTSMRVSDGLKGKLTGYTFLSRHLQDVNIGGRLEPVSHAQMRGFFRVVFTEVDRRWTNNHDGRQALEIVSSQGRELTPLADRYSLHGLRASGITHMLEDGVPPAIVSRVIAGHRSFVMTAYYNKPSPSSVMNALAIAASSIADGSLEREAIKGSCMRTGAEFASRFVVDGDLATAIEGVQPPGLWLPMLDGVCGNNATRCHEGGPVVDRNQHGPVEGGARNCGLCRFFMTGPVFLPGQIVVINGLMHQARRRAKSLQELWRQLREERSEAKKARLKNSVAHVELALDIIWRTINARCRLLAKSRLLSEAGGADIGEGRDSGDGTAASESAPAIILQFREVSALGGLDAASRVAALLPELDIQDATIERDNFINRLLERDGFGGLLQSLSPSEARTAGDAFLDGLRALAPSDVDPEDFLDRVADGAVTLFGLDMKIVTDRVTHAIGRELGGKARLAPRSPKRVTQTKPGDSDAE